MEEEISTEQLQLWAENKEKSKKKRWSNYESSLNLLRERGIQVKILNESQGHLRVGEFDFWATTGKFYNQKTGVKGRGVFNLIKIYA